MVLKCGFRKSFKRPSRGFGGQGKKGIYFMGTGEQRPNFDRNRGTKTILGNLRKQIHDIWGTSQFISGEQGNRYPLGGPHLKYREKKMYTRYWLLCIFIYNNDITAYLLTIGQDPKNQFWICDV